MNQLIDLLKDLCAIDGISGDEGRVADYICKKVSDFGYEAKRDRLGNVSVFVKGLSNEKLRMIDAHMDEVGFIVTSVTPDGYIKLAPVGGFDSRIVPGKAIRISGRKGTVPAVIGICPVHLDHNAAKAAKVPELFADMGAKDGEDAKQYVRPGDYAAFDTVPELFGNGYFKAKAIDDRIGCAVMLRHLQNGITPAYDTVFSFSTREEVGGAGVKAASFANAPDEALVLEGTTAADIPGVSGVKRVCLQNGGVVVNIKDSTIYDAKISDRIREMANEAGIPWQSKQIISGGTNAGSIIPSRGGIPCAGLSVPARYIHSPASTAALADCKAMLELSALWLESK
ncbi:MAG: M42 family metallopeptidase [Clostridia bacterium]|nr:M42 family metallopeptidase [Clostridia bacterium]